VIEIPIKGGTVKGKRKVVVIVSVVYEIVVGVVMSVFETVWTSGAGIQVAGMLALRARGASKCSSRRFINQFLLNMYQK